MSNNNKTERRFILHVSKISFVASIDQLTQPQSEIVHVEASHQIAKELAEYLMARLEKGTPGTISFQLHGTML